MKSQVSIVRSQRARRLSISAACLAFFLAIVEPAYASSNMQQVFITIPSDQLANAKAVARQIIAQKYRWSDRQFTCLDNLWTKESHWNYKARNKTSGAHGIAQALPATKMEIVGTDWRTNPVTQITWGLKYIQERYEYPCKAWSKSKRSNWY